MAPRYNWITDWFVPSAPTYQLEPSLSEDDSSEDNSAIMAQSLDRLIENEDLVAPEVDRSGHNVLAVVPPLSKSHCRKSRPRTRKRRRIRLPLFIERHGVMYGLHGTTTNKESKGRFALRSVLNT